MRGTSPHRDAPPERGVEAVLVERLPEGDGLHDMGVNLGAVIERVHVHRQPLGVRVDEELHSELRGDVVAERVHVAELPRRVDMQQGKGRLGGVEGPHRELEHHRAVLADRVEHHGLLRLGDDLAHDVDALGLEPLEMGQDDAALGDVHVYIRPRRATRTSAGAALSLALAARSSTAAASAATVGVSKIARSRSMTPRSSRTRDITCMARSE